jgi:hypothetical protein
MGTTIHYASASRKTPLEISGTLSIIDRQPRIVRHSHCPFFCLWETFVFLALVFIIHCWALEHIIHFRGRNSTSVILASYTYISHKGNLSLLCIPIATGIFQFCGLEVFPRTGKIVENWQNEVRNPTEGWQRGMNGKTGF